MRNADNQMRLALGGLVLVGLAIAVVFGFVALDQQPTNYPMLLVSLVAIVGCSALAWLFWPRQE